MIRCKSRRSWTSSMSSSSPRGGRGDEESRKEGGLRGPSSFLWAEAGGVPALRGGEPGTPSSCRRSERRSVKRTPRTRAFRIRYDDGEVVDGLTEGSDIHRLDQMHEEARFLGIVQIGGHAEAADGD